MYIVSFLYLGFLNNVFFFFPSSSAIGKILSGAFLCVLSLSGLGCRLLHHLSGEMLEVGEMSDTKKPNIKEMA